jgi:YaiO family outer membrane protein
MNMLVSSKQKAIAILIASLLCGSATAAGVRPASDAPIQLAQASGLRAPVSGLERRDSGALDEIALDVEQPGLYAREPRRAPDRDFRRLGLADTETRSRVQYALGEAWTSHFVTGSASPSDPLARQTFHGQVERTLPGGWGLGLGLRRNDFQAAATNALSLSAERDWGDFRGAYTLISGLPEGQSTESHRFQLSYQYAARSSVGLAYTSGREIDYLGWMRGLASADVTNWSLGGLHRLTPAWAITYDMVRGTQSNLTPQQGLRLGLRHDF